NKEGEIILKGTATSAEELKKAETLTKEVQGVKTVKVEAKVEAVKMP
ncbi:BON domain-containing protein, partial [Nostoc sp. CHAB 5715]